MAYGMLTSFALGAAEGLGNAIVNKYSKDQDAEIKAKADAEREARIEEAAIRSEGRASTREQSIYERNQADKTLETGAQHQWTVDTEKRASAEKLAEEQRKQAWEKDPTNPSYQSTMQQIEASKSSLSNADLSRQKTQLDINKEKDLADLTSRINAETDSTKRDELIQQAKVISGKFNDKADQIKTTEIDTGRVDENGKPVMKKILVRVEDNGSWNVLPVEERLKMAQPYDKEQATIVARDITNRQIGARVNNLLLDRDKNNSEEWDKAFAENQSKLLTTKQGDTVSFKDNKGGMLSLNKGTVIEQPIENPLDKESDLNKLYQGKNNIGGMKKEGSTEYQPSKGVANDVKAIDHQLLLYGTGESKNVTKPLTTLREVVTTWSPPKENNTAKLISDASALLKIDPDQPVDLKDSKIRGQFIKALVKQENGGEIKGDINQIYKYIDDSWGSSPLPSATKSNTSKKIISITQEK
jgi:hypothetical protein